MTLYKMKSYNIIIYKILNISKLYSKLNYDVKIWIIQRKFVSLHQQNHKL